jgi:hypothetical protein
MKHRGSGLLATGVVGCAQGCGICLLQHGFLSLSLLSVQIFGACCGTGASLLGYRQVFAALAKMGCIRVWLIFGW